MNQRIFSHHPSLLGYSLAVLAAWSIVWPMSSNSQCNGRDFRFAAPIDPRLDWVQATRNVMHVWNNKRSATFGRHRITEEFLRLEDEQMERPDRINYLSLSVFNPSIRMRHCSLTSAISLLIVFACSSGRSAAIVRFKIVARSNNDLYLLNSSRF